MQTTPAAPAGPTFFSWPVRVYYEDTDAAGVVYYANYLRYCERARTEWLREAGFGQQRMMAERGLGFVVRSFSADYRQPAVLDDALRVVSHIARLGRASIEFVQRIVRGDELLFDARVTVACVDLARRKPVALPTDVRARLSPFAAPLAAA
ncbi:tol-pal system-associated acyl-CoA thioesterase [Pseudothauera rhizosphaerae]|uniref:Tol-pal system-associated acyl-CoA thioesterase n=1 Tax=Pseudothauera rhizosphaerae TaxID=2565932 RepID=A0A4S4AJ73_9RHOO|nr:tol-pal system-associated acyl-CoA thioesterase [Pseudothauera rhizosphaerae]THF59343.1 tol-pal system-associated acyl-CoA thioesterase [Pseudothauera rhizosphaerae]